MESFFGLIGQALWPILVGCCICYFRKPLNEAMRELAGFVGRSRYGDGDGKDDSPVIDVCVPIEVAALCRAEDKVVDVVDVMTKNDYSAVPMLDDKGRLIGVVSLTRIAQKVREDGVWSIGLETTCGELDRNGRVEKVKDFRFVAQTTKVSQIRRYYQQRLRAGQDFHFVFITETGKQDEPLLGFITVWDVAVKGS